MSPTELWQIKQEISYLRKPVAPPRSAEGTLKVEFINLEFIKPPLAVLKQTQVSLKTPALLHALGLAVKSFLFQFLIHSQAGPYSTNDSDPAPDSASLQIKDRKA